MLRRDCPLGEVGHESREMHPPSPAFSCFLSSSFILFSSFTPPLPYHSCFVLLFFFHSPAISSCFLCHPSVHTQNGTAPVFSLSGGSWSPLAASAKIQLPCSLLAFSLPINENSVHWKGHMFTIPQLVGTCVPGVCAKVI